MFRPANITVHVISLLIVLGFFLTFQSATYADTYNHTAGVVCVGLNANEEKKLKRNNGSISNTSATEYAQVYCSAPAVELNNPTKVRIHVSGRQGSVNLNFKGAFALYHPTTGKQLTGRSVAAISKPNSLVRFGPAKLLIANFPITYNQTRIWIPPQSSVYSIYTKYSGEAANAQDTRPEAFALANRPTSDTNYTPDTDFSYNSSGNSNSVRRLSTGRYIVTFRGVGGVAGNVQVTTVGTPGVNCQIERWASNANVTVTVACFDSNGSATDARYSVFYRGA